MFANKHRLVFPGKSPRWRHIKRHINLCFVCCRSHGTATDVTKHQKKLQQLLTAYGSPKVRNKKLCLGNKLPGNQSFLERVRTLRKLQILQTIEFIQQATHASFLISCS